MGKFGVFNSKRFHGEHMQYNASRNLTYKSCELASNMCRESALEFMEALRTGAVQWWDG